jgi:hypothetical protein
MSCTWLPRRNWILPEHAAVVQVLREEVLAAVDDRLHHHVRLAALLAGVDDLAALVDAAPIGTVQATCLPACSALIDIHA